MNESNPQSGRELVAAGRITALRGVVEISDAELVRMSIERQRNIEQMLHAVVVANPHLIFTETHDLMRYTTRIEWEPRETSTLREIEGGDDDAR